jgi:hypothetical protein
VTAIVPVGPALVYFTASERHGAPTMSRPDPPTDPSRLSPEEFLRSLALVPWFSRLGEPSPRDHQVARIRDWHEWRGPRSPQVQALGPRSQVWYDELIEAAGPRKQEVEALWERIRLAVFEHACGAVPFDPEEDTWHGPTAAVWHAAWVAGVVGCSILLGREIPSEAMDQWGWLVEGHWPCGYAHDPDEGDPVVLLVL